MELVSGHTVKQVPSRASSPPHTVKHATLLVPDREPAARTRFWVWTDTSGHADASLPNVHSVAP